QITGHHLSIEYLYTSPDIDVKRLSGGDLYTTDIMGRIRTDPTEGTAGHGLDLQIPIVGIILDINDIVKLPMNVQLGIAASLPEQMDISYRIHDFPPDQPHFIRYGDDIDRITMAASLGIEVIKDLVYVGGGVHSMLYGPGKYYVDDLSLTEENVVAQAEFGALLEYDPMAGILITPFDKKLKIGLSWKDEQELKLGPMPILSSVFIGGSWELDVPMILDLNAFFTPEEYSAGIAYYFERFMVSIEADKQLWSEYSYSTTDRYHYYPGAPGLSGYEAGTPDFDDTINYRLGIEYRLNPSAEVMFGYCHQPTPVPDQSGRVSNYLDMDKDIFSLGASYTFKDPTGIVKEPVKIAGVFQYQMCDDITVNKNGVSGPSWDRQESYKIEGDVYAGGVSVSLSW
ncbi:MAG: hypothetical protein J7L53_04725, partial [Deltaproteobacteria bacterium]|nr:hypothetical protein [Deltaproteobacteria bacterium]